MPLLGTLACRLLCAWFRFPGTDGRANRELVAFQKIRLERGERRTVTIDVHARDMTLVGVDGRRTAVEGAWRLDVEGAAESDYVHA